MSLRQRFVWFFDQFSTPATLRTRGEPEYSSGCTGLFSIFMGIFFIYIFIIKCIEVVKLEQVEFKDLIDDKISKEKKGQVMFAFRVAEVSEQLILNPYFSFSASVQAESAVSDYYETMQDLQLELCNIDHWKGVDEQLMTSYYDIETEWLCPKKGPIQIRNTEKNQNLFEFIQFQIDFCDGDAHCQTPANIESFMNDYSIGNGFLLVQVLILDKVVQPKEQQSIKPVIKQIFATFTFQTGSIIDISMAEYEIKTDKTFFPWKQEQKETGVYFYESHSFGTVYDPQYNYFIMGRIKFSQKTLKVQRKLGKIDQVLSYVGGLFAIIVAFCAFFLNSYNQYRYELMVAGSTFTVSNRKKQIDHENFNFFLYIKYVVFDWAKILCCCQFNWQDCKQIDTAKEEATEQMDIIALFKKINYLETIIDHKFSTKDRICLQLLRPSSLQQVRRKRRILHFYEKVVNKNNVISLEQAYIELDQTGMKTQQMIIAELQTFGIQKIWLQIVKPYVEKHGQINNDVEIGEDDEDEMEDIWRALCQLSQKERGAMQGKIPIVILYQVLKFVLQNPNSSKLSLVKLQALDTTSNQILT